MSGPLLDRIDIHLEVPAVKYRALAAQDGGEPSEAVRERVDRARAVQRERFAARPGVYANAHMLARDIRTCCRIWMVLTRYCGRQSHGSRSRRGRTTGSARSPGRSRIWPARRSSSRGT